MGEQTHAQQYWQYEYDVSSRYIAPLLENWGVELSGKSVIDVGCGEGGGLCSLHDLGARCSGFDVDTDRVRVAGSMKDRREIRFCQGNLYEAVLPFAGEQFDLVVLHDVFEHLDRKPEMLEKLKTYAKETGRILITFPPYYSAYGAHQQHLRSTYGKLPFFHLIPFAMSKILPRMKREHPHIVEELQKLARNRMGMRKFEHIVRGSEVKVVGKQAYLVSPNHIRFGLKPIPAGPVAEIPILGEIVCTGVIYLLAQK